MKRWHIFLLSIPFAFNAAVLPAQEEMTKEIVMEGSRANLAAYDTVAVSPDGAPVSFATQLGATISKYKDTMVFDGLRFKAPADLKGKDFIWYFNAPGDWANWFIIPTEGDFEGGFRNWLNADKVYSNVDQPGEKGRMRVLQMLDSGYFTPGREYILWFRRMGKENGDLRGVLAFAGLPKDEKEWTHANLEKALQLKSAPPEVQADALDSRGARILLDAAFFDRAEAGERIDQVYFDLRQTRRLRGGFFITMEIACPPCHKKPSFVKIHAKHGQADFVQTSDEVLRVAKHAGGTEDKGEKGLVTHYYDYFGFEVAEGDADQKVLRVRTHANNFGDLRPPDEKPFFGQIPMKNLIVFQDKKQEVGRAYYFLEGDKKPLFIKEPPPGSYCSADGDVLEYKGQGQWHWLSYRNGKLARRIPMENHCMHGKAEGYHEDGKPSFTAGYKNGKLDGEVIEYAEDGSIKRKNIFRDGQPVKEKEGTK